MSPSTLETLRKPRQLVENRIRFAGPHSELCIYDTYRAASRVGLSAEQLLYCGMVTGHKVMHTKYHDQGQIFLPHESFIMAPGERVEIDFPDASDSVPTTCLTVEISKQRVASISSRMNDLYPLNAEFGAWNHQPAKRILHLHHTAATQQLLSRLVTIFIENHPDRDVMLDLGISELIVRMLRHQGREFILNYCREAADANSITAAVDWIKQHLSAPLDIDQLSRHACMSRSRLYVEFNKQLGCSPCELQLQQRLKGAAETIKSGRSITKTCFDFGFRNASHFSRRFRLFFGCSPREYRKRFLKVKGQHT